MKRRDIPWEFFYTTCFLILVGAVIIGAGNAVDKRFDALDESYERLDARLDELDEKLDARLDELDEKLDAKFAEAMRLIETLETSP